MLMHVLDFLDMPWHRRRGWRTCTFNTLLLSGHCILIPRGRSILCCCTLFLDTLEFCQPVIALFESPRTVRTNPIAQCRHVYHYHRTQPPSQWAYVCTCTCVHVHVHTYMYMTVHVHVHACRTYAMGLFETK